MRQALGGAVPRTTTRQITRNTPTVSSTWTHPGAVVVNVIHAHATSIVTPAMIQKSIGCSAVCLVAVEGLHQGLRDRVRAR